MGLVEFLDSLLKIGAGAFIGAALCFYHFKRVDKGEEDEKGETSVVLERWRQDKLDRSLEFLIEYNETLGDVKHAISDYIDYGGQEYENALKLADKAGLNAFNKFYAVEAYLLSAGAVEPHKIMGEYIKLISGLRREFHFSRARESTMSLDSAVIDIRACRRRLYASMGVCYLHAA